jgi:hypothetical protein
MKLTKKLLNENNIFNSYDISKKTGGYPFIVFWSAEHGKVSHNAKWQVIRIGYKTDPTEAWYNNGNKTFDIWNSTEKESQLTKAKAWVKKRYGLDITERDVWGSWHVSGTMDKLKEIIKSKPTWNKVIQELGDLK